VEAKTMAEKKGIIKRAVEKIDAKMKEKSKKKEGCCCCCEPEEDDNCCK
jgi:hypothetical protein